ncbi:MAG: hypothetical protein K0U41_06360 [Gammaproteobacteria bacterium]|nr:hypothetical protein [Gammaproteobacteria bacterium]
MPSNLIQEVRETIHTYVRVTPAFILIRTFGIIGLALSMILGFASIVIFGSPEEWHWVVEIFMTILDIFMLVSLAAAVIGALANFLMKPPKDGNIK